MTNHGRKKHQNRCVLWGVSVAVAGSLLTIKAYTQSAPGLKITTLNTNQFQVSITNGLNTVNYELYRRLTLDPLNPWVIHQIGTMGQTNFTISMGIDTSGYILGGVGSDWDGDGLKNAFDAQPSNPAVSNLVITIESPVSGTVFN